MSSESNEFWYENAGREAYQHEAEMGSLAQQIQMLEDLREEKLTPEQVRAMERGWDAALWEEIDNDPLMQDDEEDDEVE